MFYEEKVGKRSKNLLKAHLAVTVINQRISVALRYKSQMGVSSDLMPSGTSAYGYGQHGCHCKDDDDSTIEDLALLAAGAAAAIAIAMAITMMGTGRRKKRSDNGQIEIEDVLSDVINQGRVDLAVNVAQYSSDYLQ